LQRLSIRDNIYVYCMASRNSVKFYTPNSFYHVYNRGVEKRIVFSDNQDYSVFLSYLQTYLEPKDETGLLSILLSKDSSAQEKGVARKKLLLKNYHQHIELVAYALLPNHFHLLVKQNSPMLNSFMNSLGTRYAMYFNKKYKRTGVLFEDVYKAVRVESDEQLLHLSRYIHQNPFHWQKIPFSQPQTVTLPSSLPEYLKIRDTSWIRPLHILDYFSEFNPSKTYADFFQQNDDSMVCDTCIEENLD
jgi:putative transposase